MGIWDEIVLRVGHVKREHERKQLVEKAGKDAYKETFDKTYSENLVREQRARAERDALARAKVGPAPSLLGVDMGEMAGKAQKAATRGGEIGEGFLDAFTPKPGKPRARGGIEGMIDY